MDDREHYHEELRKRINTTLGKWGTITPQNKPTKEKTSNEKQEKPLRKPTNATLPEVLAKQIKSSIPQTNATLPEVITETEHIEKKIKTPPYIPIPYDLFATMRKVTMPYKLSKNKLSKKDITVLENGELSSETVVYRQEVAQGQMEFHFTKDIKPNVSLMGESLAWAIHFAIKQGTWKPTFTLGDKAKEMKYTKEQIQKGGNLWKELHNAEVALANGRYYLTNNKKGKEKVERYGSLYANLDIKGEGKGRTYTALLNPEYLMTITNPSEIHAKRHIKYPTHLLSDRTLGHYDRLFVNWLLEVKGFSTSINTEKIFKEVLNLPKQYLKRKEYCITLLDKCLALAKREDFTVAVEDTRGEGNKAYADIFVNYGLEKLKETLQEELKKTKLPSLLGDIRKWKLKIKHIGGRTAGKPKYTPTENDKDLIRQIANWGFDKFANFKIRTPREQVEKQLLGYVRLLGGHKVGEVFNRIGKGTQVYYKTPTGKTISLWVKFWNELKEAKRKQGT